MEGAAGLLAALQGSAFAAGIRQSTWLYPLANIGHIVALAAFAGAITVLDLRLAGAFAATAPGPVITAARRAAVVAFVALIATGFVLFSAEASHVAANPAFQVKLALIGLGLLNVVGFERLVAPGLRNFPPGAILPRSARIMGITSLLVWLAVAACGRAIAYF